MRKTHTNKGIEVDIKASLRLLWQALGVDKLILIVVVVVCTVLWKQKAQSSLLTRSRAVGTRTFFKSNDMGGARVRVAKRKLHKLVSRSLALCKHHI